MEDRDYWARRAEELGKRVDALTRENERLRLELKGERRASSGLRAERAERLYGPDL